MEGDPLTSDEALVEMTYRWADIEDELPGWFRPAKTEEVEEDERVGTVLAEAIGHAFRVEARVDEGENDYGHYYCNYHYDLLFDVEAAQARDAAQVIRSDMKFLTGVVRKLSGGVERVLNVRVVSIGTPAMGQVCGRPGSPPPKKHIDVTEVPTYKPDSNVPLTERDGYWLTPIEVPFYDALRDTGLIFAVQPWIQGVESRYRLDFLIFYDGGMVAVELDGHEAHKSKEQRGKDAKRDRWFAARKVLTLRWTGSEVTANATECVRQLLEVLRGTQARA